MEKDNKYSSEHNFVAGMVGIKSEDLEPNGYYNQFNGLDARDIMQMLLSYELYLKETGRVIDQNDLTEIKSDLQDIKETMGIISRNTRQNLM